MTLDTLAFNACFYNMYAFNGFYIFHLDNDSLKVFDSVLKNRPDIEQILNSSADTIVTGCKYLNNLIFLRRNHKVLVFDSLFHRNEIAESKINSIKPRAVFHLADGLWFSSSSNLVYHLDEKYSLSGVSWRQFRESHIAFSKGWGSFVYSDSLYDVYACGAGEFGGNVYFEAKKENKIFSYPLYFNDFIRCNGQYYLFEGFFMDSRYMRIDDPSKLYRPNFNDSVICCNCDSLSRKWYSQGGEKEKEDSAHGIHTYFNMRDIQTITAFVHENRLYSLMMTDSTFSVLEHNDSVKTIAQVKRVKGHRGGYHRRFIQKENGKTIIALNSTGSNGNSETHIRIDNSETALIIISGNNINIYEAPRKEVVNPKRW